MPTLVKNPRGLSRPVILSKTKDQAPITIKGTMSKPSLLAVPVPCPPEKLLIIPHLEMGDAIVCNGLVRYLAERIPNPVLLLTRRDYLDDVRLMYSDDDRIQVYGANSVSVVKGDWIPQWPGAIKLGYWGENFNKAVWDQDFYRQANVPFDARWGSFHSPNIPLTPRPKNNIFLVHEDPRRHYMVDPRRLPVWTRVDITRRPSFWDWLPEILHARELHFIDSAFLNLADTLWALGLLNETRLVWHKYARPTEPPTVRAPWEIFT